MEKLLLQFIEMILAKNTLLVYLAFFISNVLQLIFPPFPSDVILVFQGYITTVSHAFSPVFIYLNAVAATFSGSYIVYRLGYSKGNSVIKYRFIRRFISEKYIKKAEKLFKRYGSYTIAISKFIPGVNSVVILFAGIFRVKPKIVYPSIILSAMVHNILMLLLGQFIGANLSNVKKVLGTYNSIIIIIVVIILTGYIVYKMRNKISSRITFFRVKRKSYKRK